MTRWISNGSAMQILHPPPIILSDELYMELWRLLHKEDGWEFWHKSLQMSAQLSSDFTLITCKDEVKRVLVVIVIASEFPQGWSPMPVDPDARCLMTRDADICFLWLETLGGDVRRIVKPILGNTVKPRSVDSRKKDAACPPVALMETP